MKKYVKTDISAENIQEYNKIYYETVLKPKFKTERIYCPLCNTSYSQWNKFRHPMSNKHKMATNQIIYTETDEV